MTAGQKKAPAAWTGRSGHRESDGKSRSEVSYGAGTAVFQILTETQKKAPGRGEQRGTDGSKSPQRQTIKPARPPKVSAQARRTPAKNREAP